MVKQEVLTMISLCIPTYNRLPHLKKCLNSIFNGFENYPYEVIVADGGSTDGTLEYLRELDNIKLIEQGKLTGVTKACNICFKVASGNYVTSLNDDFEMYPDVLVKACKLMDKEKEIGMIGPKMQETKYGNLHNVLLWVKPYWTLLPKIFLFRSSVLKEIGYYDEHYRAYFQDVDTPLMVLKLGYTIISTRDTAITHYRIQDEDVNRSKSINLEVLKDNSDFEYLHKKFNDLEINIEEYLCNKSFKKKKALFFKKFCSTMYHSRRLRPFIKKYNGFSTKFYDWFLEQTVVFEDKKYDHLKDFFLAQRYPDEILNRL